MTSLKTFAARKPEVRRESASVYRKLHQRAKSNAESLSRLAHARASAELLNEAMAAFIALCYEAFPDGTPANVDQTGAVLIPTPFSSRNYRRYGLRRTEGDVLRSYALRLAEVAAKNEKIPPPLFIFDGAERRWYLNIFDYRSLEDALTWWERFELSANLFAKYAQYIRKKRRKWTQGRGNGRAK